MVHPKVKLDSKSFFRSPLLGVARRGKGVFVPSRRESETLLTLRPGLKHAGIRRSFLCVVTVIVVGSAIKVIIDVADERFVTNRDSQVAVQESGVHQCVNQIVVDDLKF